MEDFQFSEDNKRYNDKNDIKISPSVVHNRHNSGDKKRASPKQSKSSGQLPMGMAITPTSGGTTSTSITPIKSPTESGSPSIDLTSNRKEVFSRTNSSGSVQTGCYSSASSAQNSDEEDSESRFSTTRNTSYKDRRREAHTHAEQKRRDAIKKGYEELQELVPRCQQSSESINLQKVSKAMILQRSIEYIQYLMQKKEAQEDELDSLRKEVMALKIMKTNYEHIVKTHQSAPQVGPNQVTDEFKFQVFQSIMDKLFVSFNASISVTSFGELSHCVFSWLEEYCKPCTLRELTLSVLRQISVS